MAELFLTHSHARVSILPDPLHMPTWFGPQFIDCFFAWRLNIESCRLSTLDQSPVIDASSTSCSIGKRAHAELSNRQAMSAVKFLIEIAVFMSSDLPVRFTSAKCEVSATSVARRPWGPSGSHLMASRRKRGPVAFRPRLSAGSALSVLLMIEVYQPDSDL